MADFLDEKRKEIQARLNELKPYVDEYQLLQAADQALSGISNGTTSAPPRRLRPQRRARAAPGLRGGGGGGGRRGRPKGGGTRAAQALDLVRTGPASPSPSSPRRWGSSRTTSTA